MPDFIIKLYANKNFPIYLGLFIAILIVAFIIVFFWGRKDKKIMETKKLEKLNLEEDKNDFKEVSEKTKAEALEPNDSAYEYTKAIELSRLNNESDVKTVNIDNFQKISDSIGQELDSLEKLAKQKAEHNPEVDFLYEDTKEMVLPKLKK